MVSRAVVLALCHMALSRLLHCRLSWTPSLQPSQGNSVWLFGLTFPGPIKLLLFHQRVRLTILDSKEFVITDRPRHSAANIAECVNFKHQSLHQHVFLLLVRCVDHAPHNGISSLCGLVSIVLSAHVAMVPPVRPVCMPNFKNNGVHEKRNAAGITHCKCLWHR